MCPETFLRRFAGSDASDNDNSSTRCLLGLVRRVSARFRIRLLSSTYVTGRPFICSIIEITKDRIRLSWDAWYRHGWGGLFLFLGSFRKAIGRLKVVHPRRYTVCTRMKIWGGRFHVLLLSTSFREIRYRYLEPDGTWPTKSSRDTFDRWIRNLIIERWREAGIFR